MKIRFYTNNKEAIVFDLEDILKQLNIEEQVATVGLVIEKDEAEVEAIAQTIQDDYPNMYLQAKEYGLNLPAKMREAMSYTAKSVSDHLHKELRPDEIFELFKDTFENVTTPYNINGVHFKQLDEGRIEAQVTSNYEGGEYATAYAEGNGRLNAVSNALKQQYNLQYDLVSYTEHALEQSSSAQAIAYVGIKKPDGILSWGAGVDPDIIRASIDALVTAINNR